jgi:tetratricopeptide (TPR) repeat protein
MRIVPLVLALVMSAPGLANSVNTETIFGNPVSEGAGHMNMSPTRLDDPTFWSPAERSPEMRIAMAAREAMLRGRYAEAAGMLNSISLKRLPGANQLAGIANAKAGNLPEAERYLERAMRIDARDTLAMATLGLVRVQIGKRTEAEALLRTLETRQQRCASACERAVEIDRATQVLARALG